jgi:hypothetical protein
MRVLCHVVAIALLITAVGCGSKNAPPATPEGAVLNVSKGLSEDKPEVLWQALPESYQKDVNDLIATAAKGADPDVYNQSFGIAKKIVQVLQKKKDLIITHPMLAQANPQQLAQNWDSIVNVVSLIVNSDLSDLNKVKTLDVEKVLSTTGSQLMKSIPELSKLSPEKFDFKAKMASVKATQVKTEGDTVIVKLEMDGEPPKEDSFKKVEGKWIFKDIADNWKANVAKAKTDLEKAISASKSQNKELTLSQLKMIDGVLDQILAAKTAEEFNKAVQGGMMAVGGLIAPLMGGPKAGGAPPAPAPAPEPKDDSEEKDKE